MRLNTFPPPFEFIVDPQTKLTLVTPMMVKTSPLQKGRSCSLAVWKLYLATHSVPVDHGACDTQDRQGVTLRSTNVNLHLEEHKA